MKVYKQPTTKKVHLEESISLMQDYVASNFNGGEEGNQQAGPGFPS